MSEEMSFRQRLLSQEVLLGLIVQLSGTESVTMAAHLGVDWVWLDLEHPFHDGPWLIHALDACRAASATCAPLVRVPDLENTWIKKALDAGAEGIICPMVESAEQAQALVALCHYPPQGRRSAGPVRAAHFGLSQAQYLETAADRVVVLPQIETQAGVEHAEAILQVPGVDGVVLGPLDLSASLGVLGQTNHPQVLAAIEYVKALCVKYQKACALYCPSADLLPGLVASGITLPVLGSDVGLLGAALKTTLHPCQPSDKG